MFRAWFGRASRCTLHGITHAKSFVHQNSRYALKVKMRGGDKAGEFVNIGEDFIDIVCGEFRQNHISHKPTHVAHPTARVRPLSVEWCVAMLRAPLLTNNNAPSEYPHCLAQYSQLKMRHTLFQSATSFSPQ